MDSPLFLGVLSIFAVLYKWYIVDEELSEIFVRADFGCSVCIACYALASGSDDRRTYDEKGGFVK